MFDKMAYYNYSKKLETISMIKFGLIMLVFVIGGYFFGEYILKNIMLGIAGGVIIGIILLYLNYLKEQIKVEEMRMMLEIHDKLTKEKL